MHGAAVGALAVDDHAAREHQPPAEAVGRQRPQEHGRREIVLAHVVGDVAEVAAEADHSRLVGDRRHALERAPEGIGIADITVLELGPRVDGGAPAAVGGRQERVEDPHVAAGVEQRGDDVRADEAGAAGDEDHRPNVIRVRSCRPWTATTRGARSARPAEPRPGPHHATRPGARRMGRAARASATGFPSRGSGLRNPFQSVVLRLIDLRVICRAAQGADRGEVVREAAVAARAWLERHPTDLENPLQFDDLQSPAAPE